MHYKYCPECGSKLIDKQAGDDGDVPYCEQCQQFWFDSFGSCVIVLVANEYNEIALLQQNYMSTEHMTFVSGYITPGENAEETAMREVEEEIGIKLECLEYAGTHWFEKKGLLMHAMPNLRQGMKRQRLGTMTSQSRLKARRLRENYSMGSFALWRSRTA